MVQDGAAGGTAEDRFEPGEGGRSPRLYERARVDCRSDTLVGQIEQRSASDRSVGPYGHGNTQTGGRDHGGEWGDLRPAVPARRGAALRRDLSDDERAGAASCL